jgi:hypothetical protein
MCTPQLFPSLRPLAASPSAAPATRSAQPVASHRDRAAARPILATMIAVLLLAGCGEMESPTDPGGPSVAEPGLAPTSLAPTSVAPSFSQACDPDYATCLRDSPDYADEGTAARCYGDDGRYTGGPGCDNSPPEWCNNEVSWWLVEGACAVNVTSCPVSPPSCGWAYMVGRCNPPPPSPQEPRCEQNGADGAEGAGGDAGGCPPGV